MKRVFQLMLAVMLVAGMSRIAIGAGEHGGSEHGGHEHGGKGSMKVKHQEPTKDAIRNTMKAYVAAQTAASGGHFEVKDVDTGKIRRLSLINVHERVGKTGNYYYSCADFKDADSGEMLDLDLDVENHHGMLRVVDVRIHKVGGEPRYTYGNNDERIPLKEGTKSHLGAKGSMHKGSKKGSGHEHGGH